MTRVNEIEYTWDNNGNLLSDGVRQYSYDAANRLTSVAEGTNLTSFTYNGDGARVAQTVNGVTTGYVLDVNTPLPVVLVERPGQLNQTHYLYGLDLLADWTGGTGAGWRYYHADGLGSTRHLTNAQGQTIAGYRYDAFGALRAATGPTTPFLFTGEQRACPEPSEGTPAPTCTTCGRATTTRRWGAF